jgi:hypothetical protein
MTVTIKGKYTHVADFRFSATCCAPQCENSVTVNAGASGTLGVPKALRMFGWGMTGRSNGARWWCAIHRQGAGAK